MPLKCDLELLLQNDRMPPRLSRFSSNSELDSGSWPNIVLNRLFSCPVPGDPWPAIADAPPMGACWLAVPTAPGMPPRPAPAAPPTADMPLMPIEPPPIPGMPPMPIEPPPIPGSVALPNGVGGIFPSSRGSSRMTFTGAAGSKVDGPI